MLHAASSSTKAHTLIGTAFDTHTRTRMHTLTHTQKAGSQKSSAKSRRIFTPLLSGHSFPKVVTPGNFACVALWNGIFTKTIELILCWQSRRIPPHVTEYTRYVSDINISSPLRYPTLVKQYHIDALQICLDERLLDLLRKHVNLELSFLIVKHQFVSKIFFNL